MPDQPGAPFVVLALPRSRTAWLAAFLSHAGYFCAHEQGRHMRSADDVRRWLSQDWTGVADTSAAAHWRLIQHFRSDARVLVVRRPVEVVLDSMMALGLPLDVQRLRAYLRAIDRKLDQIERRVPGALSVRFVDMEDEATCRRVYEHCLGLPFDAGWWSTWSSINVQADLFAMQRHFMAHREPLEKFNADCKRRTLALLYRGGVQPAGDVTIQEEPFAAVWPDIQRVRVMHEAEVGPRDGALFDFNVDVVEQLEAKNALFIVTARVRDRIIGYCTAVLNPSVEDRGLVVAVQASFYVRPDLRGLGPRLQRFAVERLRARGAGELIMRAGVRGSGSKAGALYRRLGATENGELYSLNLKVA